MDLEDLSCSQCQELFDSTERCPRMLPCGHTYCQRCLAGLFSNPPAQCPEDMTPLTATAASDLPKNFSLLKVIQKKPEVRPRPEDLGRCAEHRKKLEYVCLDDRIKVCANCALFGRHRGHNVKPEEDIMREITIRAECLFDLLQLIEKSRDTVLDEQVKGSLDELLERYRHRKQELETMLQQSFQAARARLSDMERASQMTLQKNFDYIEDNFVNIRDMPKLIDSQASAWIQSAKDRLDRINLGSEDPSYVALDVLDSSSNELFQAGEKVLMELEGLKDLPISQLEELIQGVTVEYSEALLNGLIRVKSAPKQPQLAQISELRTALNPEVSKVEHPGEESSGKTSPSPTRGKSVANEAKSLGKEGKFEEALDALRLHTSETADFKGAGDLSERGHQIVPLLTSNLCLKSLKFVKNNLSDSVLMDLMNVLQENSTLHTLHILHNAMSAEVMDSVIEMLNINTTLRVISLAGNPELTPEYRAKFAAMANKYRKIQT